MTCSELGRMSQTSQQFRRMCEDNSLWMPLVDRTPGIGPIRRMHSLNWKSYYREKLTFNAPDSMRLTSPPSVISRPSARCSHSASVIGDVAVFIGGQDGNIRFREVYHYHPRTREFELIPFEGTWQRIARHTAANDSKRIYVCGGHDGISSFHKFSVYTLETRTWSHPKCTGDIPPDRSNAVASIIGNTMYYYGGNAPLEQLADSGDEVYQTFSDLYELNLDTFHWTNVTRKVTGDIPCPRSGHRMMSFGGLLYLFGGGQWNQIWTKSFNDLFVFNPETYVWSRIEPRGLSPNTTTFAISYMIGAQLFIFGGAILDQNRVHGDTYAFDTVTEEWKKVDVGNCRVRSLGTAMVFDNTVRFFGGYCGGAVDYYNEVSFDWIPCHFQD